MNGFNLSRLAISAFFVLILASCSNENTASDCSNSPQQQKTANKLVTDFGDGSDGEFYLANADAFYLQEKTYNFSNVNLEAGSRLTLSDAAAAGDGTIQINSLGACNLLGELDFGGYQGSLIINCSAGLVIADQIKFPDGNTSLNTADSSLSANGGSSELIVVTDGGPNMVGSGGEISTGSIDISASDLSLSNNQAGPVIQTPDTTVDLSQYPIVDCHI
jgi:hypothetical protein